MKKRIFAIFICICMLLPMGALFVNAGASELEISRYFSGDESDWEIHQGNTNLVLRIKSEDVQTVSALIDQGALTWYLNTNGESYQVNPGSHFLVGESENEMVIRFPTFEYGFCPAVNPIRQTGEDAGIYYDIEISAKDANGATLYYGKVEGLHSDVTDPEIPGVPALNGSRYDNGFRNTETATELLFTIKESIAPQLYADRANYTWRFSVADSEGVSFFEAQPTSFVASSQLFTFEPCVATKQFIPKKNVTYFINLELWQDDKMVYFAGSTIYGYTLVNRDPIIPQKKYQVTFRMGPRVERATFFEGQMPEMPSDTSIPSESAAYEYEFTGWNPAPQKVTANITYTATYEKVPAKYKITFETERETRSKIWTYGEIPFYEGDLSPIRQENGNVRVFVGWNRRIGKVICEATYRAQYKEVTADKVPTLQASGGHIYRNYENTFVYSVSEAASVTSFTFDIVYDKERFTLVKAEPLVAGVQCKGDKVTYKGKALDAKTELVALTLRANEKAPYGSAVLTAANAEFYNGSEALGYFQKEGTLQIGGILSGDIDRDCRVNTADADSLLKKLLKRASLSTDTEDTNHDGVVDLRDAVRICSYVSGQTTKIWSIYDETQYTLVYRAEVGGEIVGTGVQTLTRTQQGETVYAMPYTKNYVFAGWSDGKTNFKRQDHGVEENKVLTARFEEQPISVNLPEVHIHTLDGEDVTSKSEYLTGMFNIVGSDTKSYNVSNLPMEIRGRGNYSWDALRDLKPSYRVRLTQKQSLLGMDAERDWVLLTVYNDVSMLRNYITGRLSQMFENLPHGVKGEFVTLYLNEEYCGVYLLCERIEASRLDLNDEADTLDKDYLFEMDARAAGEGQLDLDWFYAAGAQQPFVIKSEIRSTAETRFLKSMVEKMNKALLSGDRKTIETMVDIPSLVDVYIIEEFGKDRDVGFSSLYIMKKAGGKFYFTSPWDFDLAWGNDEAYPATDGLVSTGGQGNAWFAVLSEQAWFKVLVRERMKEKSHLVEALGKELLAMGVALTDAAKKDEAYFDTLGRKLMVEPYQVYSLGSYKDHYQYLYRWYTERWQWLCNHFGVKAE